MVKGIVDLGDTLEAVLRSLGLPWTLKEVEVEREGEDGEVGGWVASRYLV